MATYEKYLALLSAGGIPKDMTSTVVICDEIQLVGDEHRGQNVEVLLSLLRNAGWRQLVGLSAVLKGQDAQEWPAGWGISLVVEHTREKHLRYECWTSKGIAIASSEYPDRIDEGIPLPASVDLETVAILHSMAREADPPLPVIVFLHGPSEKRTSWPINS